MENEAAVDVANKDDLLKADESLINQLAHSDADASAAVMMG